VKVEIDLDALILKAAARSIDRRFEAEWACLVKALQEQMPEGVDIIKRLRIQVKEYKKLLPEG
jgi:hypothetical protein